MGPHLLLQAAAAVDDGPEGLGDAQVPAQHQHVHLRGGGARVRGGRVRLAAPPECPP